MSIIYLHSNQFRTILKENSREHVLGSTNSDVFYVIYLMKHNEELKTIIFFKGEKDKDFVNRKLDLWGIPNCILTRISFKKIKN